jgi:putative inorganic carbon (hco3(-)) transporter
VVQSYTSLNPASLENCRFGEQSNVSHSTLGSSINSAQSGRPEEWPEELKATPAPPGLVASVKGIWRGIMNEPSAFVITCLYLLFEYLRPQLIYPALDIIPWGKLIIFFAILGAFSDKTSIRPPKAAVVPLLIFSSSVLLSTITAFSFQVASGKLIDFFSWVFVVLLVASVVSTRARLFYFMAVYFLCNFKMAQFGFKSWAMNGFGFSSWGVTGSPGWFQNSGEFSLEMDVFLPFVLAYIATFRQGWSRNVRYFFYLLAVMSVGSCIACSSRGGLMGLVVVGLWSLAFSRSRIKALVGLSVAAAVIFYLIPPEFKARFDTAGEDKTSLTRLLYWEYGREAIRDNPFSGVGFRNWTYWAAAHHPELIGVGGKGEGVEVIHNTYMECATELGYYGAGAYLLLVLQILYMNLRSAKIARRCGDSFLAATAIAVNGSLLAYLVPSYFMSVLYYPYIWIMLAFTVCVSTVSHQCSAQAGGINPNGWTSDN